MKLRLLALAMAAMMFASPLASTAQAFESLYGTKDVFERDHNDRRVGGQRPTPQPPKPGHHREPPPPPPPIRPPYHSHHHDRDRHDSGSSWIAAGILGALTVGSIIASQNDKQPEVVYAEPPTYYDDSSTQYYYQQQPGTQYYNGQGQPVYVQPSQSGYYDAYGNWVPY